MPEVLKAVGDWIIAQAGPGRPASPGPRSAPRGPTHDSTPVGPVGDPDLPVLVVEVVDQGVDVGEVPEVGLGQGEPPPAVAHRREPEDRTRGPVKFRVRPSWSWPTPCTAMTAAPVVRASRPSCRITSAPDRPEATPRYVESGSRMIRVGLSSAAAASSISADAAQIRDRSAPAASSRGRIVSARSSSPLKIRTFPGRPPSSSFEGGISAPRLDPGGQLQRASVDLPTPGSPSRIVTLPSGTRPSQSQWTGSGLTVARFVNDARLTAPIPSMSDRSDPSRRAPRRDEPVEMSSMYRRGPTIAPVSGPIPENRRIGPGQRIKARRRRAARPGGPSPPGPRAGPDPRPPRPGPPPPGSTPGTRPAPTSPVARRVRPEGAVRRARDGVLQDAHARPEEPRDEVETPRIGTTCDDDPGPGTAPSFAGSGTIARTLASDSTSARTSNRVRPARTTATPSASASRLGSASASTGVLGKSRVIQPSALDAESIPLRVRNRATASGARCPSCQRRCAEASVAWPQRSTSTRGVNHRR